MVVVEGGDDVGADPALGEGRRDPSGQAHRGEAGLDGERDPRPAPAGPDRRHPLGLADQGEGVAKGDSIYFSSPPAAAGAIAARRKIDTVPICGRGLEAILHAVERRGERREQSIEVGFAAQPRLRSRVARVLSLSAFSLMKPAASRWL